MKKQAFEFLAHMVTFGYLMLRDQTDQIDFGNNSNVNRVTIKGKKIFFQTVVVREKQRQRHFFLNAVSRTAKTHLCPPETPLTTKTKETFRFQSLY